MSNSNFNSDIDDEQILDGIEDQGFSENITTNKSRNKRKWREIEALLDRKKLRLELQDLEDYEL
jgi:hypothetical protein